LPLTGFKSWTIQPAVLSALYWLLSVIPFLTYMHCYTRRNKMNYNIYHIYLHCPLSSSNSGSLLEQVKTISCENIIKFKLE
jgi:hypothetical protein